MTALDQRALPSLDAVLKPERDRTARNFAAYLVALANLEPPGSPDRLRFLLMADEPLDRIGYPRDDADRQAFAGDVAAWEHRHRRRIAWERRFERPDDPEPAPGQWRLSTLRIIASCAIKTRHRAGLLRATSKDFHHG